MRMARLQKGIVFLIAVWAVPCFAFTQTKDYAPHDVHGWIILIAPEYQDDPDSRAEALFELDRQLGNIARAVPEPALSHIRRTRIWLEYRRDDPQRSVYHRSAGWLRQNGQNPDKAKAIEVDHGVVTRIKTAPWSMLHELAHAYYDTVLERRSAALDTAYAAAVERGDYEDVLRNTGRRQKAYALQNVSEFFAELSEAYFGVNDFEPFDRRQLRSFDPVSYAVIEELWLRP